VFRYLQERDCLPRSYENDCRTKMFEVLYGLLPGDSQLGSGDEGSQGVIHVGGSTGRVLKLRNSGEWKHSGRLTGIDSTNSSAALGRLFYCVKEPVSALPVRKCGLSVIRGNMFTCYVTSVAATRSQPRNCRTKISASARKFEFSHHPCDRKHGWWIPST
jgi:hypothetical protein